MTTKTEQWQAWYAKNKESRKAYMKKYREENRERINSNAKRLREENIDRYRENEKKSYKKNKHKRPEQRRVQAYGEEAREIPDKCQICGRGGRICVDHCHDTGKVRGFLCLRCNTALGQVGDNEEAVFILDGLISYLKEFHA